MDDILLFINDINILPKAKDLISNNFEIKSLGDISKVLGIQIYQDHSQHILGFSKKNYIKRYSKDMACKTFDQLITSLAKGGLSQCYKNDLKVQEMQEIAYALVLGIHRFTSRYRIN